MFRLSRLLHKSLLILAAVSLGSTLGCTSIPQKKGSSQITAQGVAERTSLELNHEILKSEHRLPPGITLSRPLHVEEAAALALWNNLQFNADLAGINLLRGDLIDSNQIRNPRVDLLFPVAAKPFEFLLNLPIEAIWERPARMRAANAAYEQYATHLIQVAMNVIQDAKIAFANLQQAKKREQILKEAATVRKRIAMRTSHERVRTGQMTESEGIASEVESAASEELWVRAQHDTRIAQERFRFVLGITGFDVNLDVTDFSNSDSNRSGETEQSMFVQKMAEEAWRDRADLRALDLGIKAAVARANWESSRIAQLSVLLSVKDVGNSGRLAGPGLSTEIPLFHQNGGRRERADAEIELLSLQYLGLKQRVAFEVREAFELLQQSDEVLLRTRARVLPKLEKTVQMAEREYRRGTASYLFVLEQTRGLVDARLREADFEAAVSRARAQLQRARGRN